MSLRILYTQGTYFLTLLRVNRDQSIWICSMQINTRLCRPVLCSRDMNQHLHYSICSRKCIMFVHILELFVHDDVSCCEVDKLSKTVECVYFGRCLSWLEKVLIGQKTSCKFLIKPLIIVVFFEQAETENTNQMDGKPAPMGIVQQPFFTAWR